MVYLEPEDQQVAQSFFNFYEDNITHPDIMKTSTLISSTKLGRILPLVIQIILIDLALASEALLLFQLQAVPSITSDDSIPIVDKVNEGRVSNDFRVYEKRSYVDLRCRGMYAPRIFAHLDRVCDDCYNLYRDPEVHTMCREGCFTTTTFQNCLRNLLLDKESQFYQELVDIIGKKK